MGGSGLVRARWGEGEASMAKSKRVQQREIERARYDLDGIEPVVLTSRTDQERGDTEVEMIHAFSIDDVEYYMPRKVPFHVAMRSMDIAGSQGEAAAIRYQLSTLLGEEGYAALLQFQDLEPEHFARITTIANKIIMSSQVDAGKAR